MFQAALFDLDGVVIDTESQYTTFWTDIFKRYHCGGEVQAKKIKGQTLTQIYHTYFADNIELQRLISSELNEFEQHMNYPYILGSESFIKSLRDANIPTALVTSSNQEKMKNVFSVHPELPSYFKVILTADDISHSKPAPDGYLLAASRLGVPSTECVVFEDSINGLKSGRSAGTKVIGLSTTNPQKDIVPLSDLVIPNFSTIASLEWLNEQIR